MKNSYKTLLGYILTVFHCSFEVSLLLISLCVQRASSDCNIVTIHPRDARTNLAPLITLHQCVYKLCALNYHMLQHD